MGDRLERARRKAADANEKLRRHQRITESPWDRLTGLAQDMLLSPTLANIVLGSALSTSVTAWFGLIPGVVAVVNWLLWAFFLGVYLIGQELVHAYEAAADRFEDETKGIE